MANTGWGIIESENNRIHYLAHGCIETSKDKPHAMRLLDIALGLEAVIAQWKPLQAAIENLYFSKNAKTAMPVAEGRGVVCVTLAKSGLVVHEFNPNVIKMAVCGVSLADKTQVQQMVRLILGLQETPHPDHAADALAAAICAVNTLGLV